MCSPTPGEPTAVLRLGSRQPRCCVLLRGLLQSRARWVEATQRAPPPTLGCGAPIVATATQTFAKDGLRSPHSDGCLSRFRGANGAPATRQIRALDRLLDGYALGVAVCFVRGAAAPSRESKVRCRLVREPLQSIGLHEAARSVLVEGHVRRAETVASESRRRARRGNLAVELSSSSGGVSVLTEVRRAALERAAGWPPRTYRCVSKAPTGRLTRVRRFRRPYCCSPPAPARRR